MNASQVGSKDWWLVIQSMPFEEALAHLHNYRSSLVRYNAGNPQYIAASAELIRVNAETKRINRIIDHSRWYNACRNILDQETFDAVIMEKRRLEDEAKEMQ